MRDYSYWNIPRSLGNSAEIAPVNISNNLGEFNSLDIRQCSNQTKQRILFNKIESEEFD